MDFSCKWLPSLILFADYNGNWNLYRDKLYQIFLRDFVDNELYFDNKKVNIRINPKENGFEHAFIHLTCESNNTHNDINDRIPDFRRCERLEWNRKIIEHYPCLDSCSGCSKIFYYEEEYKNKIRIVLLFENVRFKVVLEKREKYILLITGYYINYNHTLKKELAKANLYLHQKTPLS